MQLRRSHSSVSDRFGHPVLGSKDFVPKQKHTYPGFNDLVDDSFHKGGVAGSGSLDSYRSSVHLPDQQEVEQRLHQDQITARAVQAEEKKREGSVMKNPYSTPIPEFGFMSVTRKELQRPWGPYRQSSNMLTYPTWSYRRHVSVVPAAVNQYRHIEPGRSYADLGILRPTLGNLKLPYYAGLHSLVDPSGAGDNEAWWKERNSVNGCSPPPSVLDKPEWKSRYQRHFNRSIYN